MEYKRIGQRNDLGSLYKEVRINIIRVNNQFCTKTFEEDGEYCLDLFDMFDDPSVDISPIIGLAFQMEGLEEALEDEPEEIHWSELRYIAFRLEKEMMKLE
jgi:hypothetical protein